MKKDVFAGRIPEERKPNVWLDWVLPLALCLAIATMLWLGAVNLQSSENSDGGEPASEESV